VRVRRLTIKNFRGIEQGVVNFSPHTLLVGGNNTGKSTVCEALDLVLGPERLFRRPVVDEHDFHKGLYLDKDGNPQQIEIEAVLIDLPEDLERKAFPRTRPWSESKDGFVDEAGAKPEDTDDGDVCRALPVKFIGWYDRAEDDFVGDTFFSHPVEEVDEDHEDFGKPSAGLSKFSREWKRQCGFIYLRTLRTGRRALSLERGSLLDTILRLGDKGKESMWEDTVKRLRDFDPPIGTIPQLDEIRKQVRERMSKFVGIMDPDLFQVRLLSCAQPCAVQHPRHRVALVGEHMGLMYSPPGLDHRSGNPVQHHQPLIAVFHIPCRYDEHRCLEGGNLHFPFPPQLADFAIPAAGVDGKQRHLGQMRRQIHEQLCLFLPGKRVGLAFLRIRQQPYFRSAGQPGEPMLIDPLARCEVQYPPHHLQTVIDGASRRAFLAAVLDPGF